MAIASATDEGTRADVEFILAALIRQAHADAEHVAGFISDWLWPLGLRRATAFPPEFLLELAAIVRIAAWQRAGCTSALKDTFPPARELLEDLIRRFISDPMSFDFEVSSVRRGLCSQVFSTWISRCAWNASSEIGADVWFTEIDEDLLLNLMADFLHKIRHLAIEE